MTDRWGLYFSNNLPGLSRIGPNQAPGGLVLMVYSLEGDLILKRAFPAPWLPDREPSMELLHEGWDQVKLAAEIDSAFVAMGGPQEVAIICYDGDSGMRVSPQDFM